MDDYVSDLCDKNGEISLEGSQMLFSLAELLENLLVLGFKLWEG